MRLFRFAIFVHKEVQIVSDFEIKVKAMGSEHPTPPQGNERATNGRFAGVPLPLNLAPAVKTLGNRRSNGKTHDTAAGLIAQ